MACVASTRLSSVGTATAVVAKPAVGGGSSSVLSRQNAVVGGFKARSLSPLLQNKSRLTMSARPSRQISLAHVSTAAMVAATIVPEIAQAAGPGVTPSLQNLLLSVAAGGVIFAGIVIVVAGVSTFDPVKRR